MRQQWARIKYKPNKIKLLAIYLSWINGMTMHHFKEFAHLPVSINEQVQTIYIFFSKMPQHYNASNYKRGHLSTISWLSEFSSFFPSSNSPTKIVERIYERFRGLVSSTTMFPYHWTETGSPLHVSQQL